MGTLPFLVVVLHLGLVGGDTRGTLGRHSDAQFQLLISGGSVPDNGRLLRSVVSIRTLKYIYCQGDNHFCTGTIVSSRTVLTAAHCVTDFHRSVTLAKNLLIVFGIVRRLEPYHEDDTRRVSKIFVHPKYRRWKKYDVALMRLDSLIPGNLRWVKPLSLDARRRRYFDNKCTTMGWGQVYPHGPYADEAMYLEVLIHEDHSCDKLDNFNKQMFICTEPLYQGEVCPGDLGSPLMCDQVLAGFIGGIQKCEGGNRIKFVRYKVISNWVESILATSNHINSSPVLCIILFTCGICFSN